ncbi:MAG: D-alanine--D-alanine ligase [Trueperaceae bacterium]|nr:D-alanine--D-alanine ligase [Trueperaceae bacterium]
MPERPRVLLLCGGPSAEHDVSLASARSLLAATGDRVAWLPRVISRRGHWLDAHDSLSRLTRTTADDRGTTGETGPRLDLAALADVDAVFPLLHGPYGEDGRLQGALEVLGVPYVGSSVLASAVGMDKLAMKALFREAELPQVAYRGVTRHRWGTQREAVDAELDGLGWPAFVKPANLGSSIGIARVADRSERDAAIEEAFTHDRRVIVEAAASGARELEVAVLGLDDPRTSVVGEIHTEAAFYDYAAKYTPGAASLDVPADVPAPVADACRAYARRAFQAIDGAGLARVDLFWQPERDALWVNEINTMPGFTETSMFPRLWAATGLAYPDLALHLIELARTAR